MVVLMIATAVGIEVAYVCTQKANGFAIETFDGFASTQFLGVSISLAGVPVVVTYRSPVLPPRHPRVAFASILGDSEP